MRRRQLDELLLVPIVGAPMAGGQGTAALAAAVSDAGGLGFVAAGYKTTAAVETEIATVRAATRRPFGVNIFFPTRDRVDESALTAYAHSLAGEEERYGVRCGEPRWTDDEWEAKLELVARERPAVVSFTFGFPDRERVASLHELDIDVWATVTSAGEAGQAIAAGATALVVQGAEAGGHHGSWINGDDEPQPLLSLLRQMPTSVPLIAAGGIGDAAGVAEVRAAGAAAAQVGSALMLTTEAATSSAHREALRGDRRTRLTRAFSGRRARGIVNRFMEEHERDAPRGYPEVHYLTAPLRARARELGDSEGINLWAGVNYRLAEEMPAAELVERWAKDTES